MKTNEFIKEVEALGFVTRTLFGTGVSFNTNDGEIVLIVGGENVYKINCCHNAYDELEPCTREKLFKLAVEYASTPLEKRVEEKKYYIKLKGIDEHMSYLNYDNNNGSSIINNKHKSYMYVTQFTKQEIKKYGLEKFVDNELFELIEVK